MDGLKTQPVSDGDCQCVISLLEQPATPRPRHATPRLVIVQAVVASLFRTLYVLDPHRGTSRLAELGCECVILDCQKYLRQVPSRDLSGDGFGFPQAPSFPI